MRGAAIAVSNKPGAARRWGEKGRGPGWAAAGHGGPGGFCHRLLGVTPRTLRVTSPVPPFRVKVPLVVLFVLIYSCHSANRTDFLFLFKYLYMCVIALCSDSLQSRRGNKEQTISVR